jgi:hypothetical protein
MVYDLCGQQEEVEDSLKATKGNDLKPLYNWYIVKIWQGKAV